MLGINCAHLVGTASWTRPQLKQNGKNGLSPLKGTGGGSGRVDQIGPLPRKRFGPGRVALSWGKPELCFHGPLQAASVG